MSNRKPDFRLSDVPDLIADWRSTSSPRLHHLADQLQAMYDAGKITLTTPRSHKPIRLRIKQKP
jgi:hypothetical protein